MRKEVFEYASRVGLITNFLITPYIDYVPSPNLLILQGKPKESLSLLEQSLSFSVPRKINVGQFSPYFFDNDTKLAFPIKQDGISIFWIEGTYSAGRFKTLFSTFDGSNWMVPKAIEEDSTIYSTGPAKVATTEDETLIILFNEKLCTGSFQACASSGTINKRLAISHDGGESFDQITNFNHPSDYPNIGVPIIGANERVFFPAIHQAYLGFARFDLLVYDLNSQSLLRQINISGNIEEIYLAAGIPRVFTDNFGKMFAVWINRDGSLKFRRSVDNGNTFEETQVFSPENGVQFNLPRVVAKDNTVAMVWSDRTALRMLLSQDGGRTFGAVRSIAYPGSGEPQLINPTAAIDSRGNMVVGWTKVPQFGTNFEFAYIVSDDRGQTFSAPIIYSDFKTQTRETPFLGEFLFDKYDRLQLVLATHSYNLWFVRDIKSSLMPRPFADLPFDYDLNNNGVESQAEFIRASSQYFYADGRFKSNFDHENPGGGNPNYEKDGVILLADGTRVTNAFGSDCTPQETACGYRISPGSYFIYYDGHDGIDILPSPLSIDNPVLAIAEGTVTEVKAGENEDADFGEMIEIKHANGIISRYGHLKRGSITVNVGDTVTRDKNRPIGIMGSTGNSTSDHLHLTVAHDVDGSNTIELSEKIDPFFPDTYLWVKPWIVDRLVDPVIGANLTIPDMGISMQIQPEVVTQTLTIKVAKSTTVPPPENFGGTNIAFTASSVDSSGQEINNFAKPVTLTVSYADLDLININEDSLRLYFWNPTSAAWEVLETILDKINRTVQVSLISFGAFALLGEMIAVPTATPTSTETPSPEASATSTVSSTPSETATAIITIFPSVTPTPQSTPTASQTATETPQSTSTATVSPSQTETPRLTPTPTSSQTVTATSTHIPTNTPTPTLTPFPAVLPSPTSFPKPTATLIPDPEPTLEPQPSPTNGPRTIFFPLVPIRSNMK